MTKKGFTRRDLLGIGGAVGGAALVTSLAPGEIFAGDKKAKLPQVPRRMLGKTKKDIPILLMGGAMPLDQRFDPKLAECMRFGVNYIDAADCYAGGSTETAVGNFVERAKIRDKVWITSKSDKWDPKGFESTLATSLKKMKTSYVDMYYLHALNDASALSKDLEKTVARLKKSGKIRHFGFSCHDGNVVELLNLAATLPWVESIMFKYNFRSYGDKALNKAIDACKKADIGLIAMKTQGAETMQQKGKAFQQKGKWTKHQAVLKAVWADPRISAAVSHMNTFAKLKQNIAAALDKQELGAIEQEELNRYAEATRAFACDGCDHLCNPAVDAPVKIGTTMRFLMYHDVYGEQEKAKELFRKLPSEIQGLANVDFKPANKACPHGIDVAAHMKRAGEIFTA